MSTCCFYSMHTNDTANLHSNVSKPLLASNTSQPAIKTSVDLSVNPSSGLVQFVKSPATLKPNVQREGQAKKLNLFA